MSDHESARHRGSKRRVGSSSLRAVALRAAELILTPGGLRVMGAVGGLLICLLGGLLVRAAADDPGAVAGWATVGLGAGVLVSAAPLPAGVRYITVPLIFAAACVLYAMIPTFWRDSLAVTGGRRSLTQGSAPLFAFLWWSAAACLLAGSVCSVWIAAFTGPGTGRRRDSGRESMG